MASVVENAECLKNMYKFIVSFSRTVGFCAFTSVTENPKLFYAINITVLLGLWHVIINDSQSKEVQNESIKARFT
jgi:hypothetical protein